MTTIDVQLTGATLNFELTNAPDLPHSTGRMMVPSQVEIVYRTEDSGELSTQVTVDGLPRRSDRSVGTARRWVRYEFGHTQPRWIQELVANQIPDGLGVRPRGVS